MTNDKSFIKVLHSFPVWLPQTQTWLYQQVQNLPDTVTSHIVCKETENLEQFGLPNIHSLMGGSSYASRLTTRCFRHLDFHLYNLWVTKKEQPDILHSHFGPVAWKNFRFLQLLPTSRRRRVRHIVTFYGQDVGHLPKVNPVWKKRYRDMLQNVDMVLCEGSHMAQQVRMMGGDSSLVKVHHLGVNLDDVPFKLRKKKDDLPFRILMAAAFRPKKGLIYGLQALDRLAGQYDLEVTLVGDATGEKESIREKEKIMAFIRNSNLSGRIAFTGFLSQKQLNRLSRDHHIYMAPSVTADDGDSEGGAPISLIEMAASGMPVISTRHCDIPEVIPEGVCGLLADEKDVDELTSHLGYLLSNPDTWQELAVNARMHLEDHYDAKKQGQKLANRYHKIMRKSSAASSGTRILFLSHSGHLYGAERSLLSLLRELNHNDRYRIMVFLPQEGAFSKALREEQVPYQIVPMTRWMGKRFRSLMRQVRGAKRYGQSRRLQKAASDFEPDVIYTNTLAIDAGATLVETLGKRPLHLWHARELPENPDFGYFDTGQAKALERIAATTDLLLCNSGFLSDEMKKLFEGQSGLKSHPPVRVIYNGFHFLEDKPETKRNESKKPIKLMMAGSIAPLKNYTEAIEALKILVEEGISLSMDIYGSGSASDENALSETIRKAGLSENVKLRGYSEDLEACFRQADLALITSKLETFGRVAVEAMAQGCPVISSNAGGLSEIVTDGETGMVYEPGNPQDLAKKIREISDDPELRTRLTEKAFHFVRSQFSMAQYINNVDETLQALTDSGKNDQRDEDHAVSETDGSAGHPDKEDR